MDTLEFLQTVLPPEGVYYLVLAKPGDTPNRHRPFTDLAEMAEACAQLANSELSIYFACGSYKAPYVETTVGETTKRRWRVAANQERARAFWVDVDCGPEKAEAGKGYATKADAAKALFGFADQIGWPRPMLVDSGYGIHGYWPLTKAIRMQSWVPVATALKASLAHAGVLADPTRTADFASVLRPAATFNRKRGEAREVRVKSQCAPCEPADLNRALAQYIRDNEVKVSVKAARVPPPEINSDLTAHLANRPYIDSSGAKAAEGCAQMRQMRDTQGDVPYEQWRRVIGVLKHCVDGEELAPSWSAEREATGHTSVDWQEKFESWDAGPAGCEGLEEANPGGCDGCPYKGKIKSPIVLGRLVPENEEVELEAVDDEGHEEVVVAPALTSGYVWASGVMARLLPDKDGVIQAYPFSNLLFYPVSRIRSEDGTYKIGIRMHLPNKRVRDFLLSAEAMASQTDMLRGLAKYELMQTNHRDAGSHMAAYLRDQLEDLKRRVDEVKTYSAFGWCEEGFLIGDRLHQFDGTMKEVLLGGRARAKAAAFPPPRGSLAKYASAVNWLYNRDGAQHWQYALCAGWGSILTGMAEDLYHGLMLALRGGDSGKGKTTVCHASLYAYGDATKLAINSKDGATANAIWATLGALGNMPLLFDELTNMDGKAFSDLAYNFSNGKEKDRLISRQGSTGFAEVNTWNLAAFVTGNRDFYGLLASYQPNSQAEGVRLIQIDVDLHPVVTLVEADKPRDELSEEELAEVQARESTLAHRAIEQMKANCGTAGEAIIRYVVANKDAVQTEVRTRLAALSRVISAPKFRMYRSHAACTLTAAKIAKDLGIADFDLDALEAYAERLMLSAAETVSEVNTVSLEDAYNRMTADLSSRVVVTAEFRDKRHKFGPETPRNRIYGAIAGRYVLGTAQDRTHAGHIMLNQKDVRDWCIANRLDMAALLDHLAESGCLLHRSEKLTITRGTDLPTVRARCVVIDGSKMDRDGLTLVSGSGGGQDELVASC